MLCRSHLLIANKEAELCLIEYKEEKQAVAATTVEVNIMIVMLDINLMMTTAKTIATCTYYFQPTTNTMVSRLSSRSNARSRW